MITTGCMRPFVPRTNKNEITTTLKVSVCTLHSDSRKRVIFYEVSTLWNYIPSCYQSHHPTGPSPLRVSFNSQATALCPFTSSLAESSSFSLPNKLSITLAVDISDRVDLDARLPTYFLRMSAALISDICALFGAASLWCSSRRKECNRGLLAILEIAESPRQHPALAGD